MKLYLVKRTDNFCIYENYYATVVAAPAEKRARELALEQFSQGDDPSSDEYLQLFLLAEHTLVPEGIILSDFNAA